MVLLALHSLFLLVGSCTRGTCEFIERTYCKNDFACVVSGDSARTASKSRTTSLRWLGGDGLSRHSTPIVVFNKRRDALGTFEFKAQRPHDIGHKGLVPEVT